MTNLIPPKIMGWKKGLEQKYQAPNNTLLTSGCSFTAWTNQLDVAATWPGYVKDRCGFNCVIDYSYPGAGNSYIGDSILNHLESLSDHEIQDYTVIIMWSGLNRIEEKISDLGRPPCINGVSYRRNHDSYNYIETDKNKLIQGAIESAKKMFEVKNYLEKRNIIHVFTTYVNLLFPPYIRKLDTTHEFTGYVSKETLNQLQHINWIPTNPLDFMYEYGWRKDLLDDDGFHPSINCSLHWSDEILLPEMAKRGIILPL